MPEKEKKIRKPKAEAPKPDGTLSLTFKHKFTPEEKSAITAKIKELEESIQADRKALAEAKRQEKAKGTATRVAVKAEFREADGVLLVTGPDGKDIPLRSMTDAQIMQCSKAARAVREAKA